MQIQDIHIDGFGIFRDKKVSGLSTGINVIYGLNEFGKTTLLEFIRRILFGFPDKKVGDNPYPALTGGTAYGGSLTCEMSDGEKVIVTRKSGPHGGTVSVITDSTELRDDNPMKKVFRGNVTRTFYQNVYAIGLNELRTIAMLEQDEIREHMYSASLGLGNITLKQLRDHFTKTADGLFKPAGRAQKIATVTKEISDLQDAISGAEQAVSIYDGFVEERNKLEVELESLKRQIDSLRQQTQRLEKWNALFPRYVDMQTAQKELADLPGTADFQPDALAKLENFQIYVAQAKVQLKEAEDKLRETQAGCDALNYDNRILSQEANIIRLQRKSELYRAAANDIDVVMHQESALKEAINREGTRIGPGWTREKIRNTDLSYLSMDKINSFKQDFSGFSDKIKRLEIKLESCRESMATKAANTPRLPALLMYISIAISLLGLIGIAAGLAYGSYLTAIISGLALIGGLALVISYFSNRPGLTADELTQNYQRELNSANAENGNLKQRWQEFLVSIDLPSELTPDGVEDLRNAIAFAQSKIAEADNINERIDSMRKTIGSTDELHREISDQLDKIILSGSIEADIEILTGKMEEAKNSEQQRKNLNQSIQQQKQRIEVLKQDYLSAEAELRSYLTAHGSADSEDFQSKYGTWEKRQRLTRTIGEALRNIQSIAGVGEQCDRFIESMQVTNKLEIESQLAEVSSQLESLNAERDGKFRRTGELDNRITGMTTGEELLSKQGELEVKRQQLNDLSREWAQAQAVLFILDKAVAKYEQTRQPAVINTASRIFKCITDDAYSSVSKPIDSDEFVIRHRDNTSKTISQLSRGTTEQLLLALRLGLIEVYEAGNEPLPIIMDDILVNFDDIRGPRAMEALVEFASTRQILVLTCHENTLNSYIEAGARRINLI